jgi:hypothetical protein
MTGWNRDQEQEANDGGISHHAKKERRAVSVWERGRAVESGLVFLGTEGVSTPQSILCLLHGTAAVQALGRREETRRDEIR